MEPDAGLQNSRVQADKLLWNLSLVSRISPPFSCSHVVKHVAHVIKESDWCWKVTTAESGNHHKKKGSNGTVIFNYVHVTFQSICRLPNISGLFFNCWCAKIAAVPVNILLKCSWNKEPLNLVCWWSCCYLILWALRILVGAASLYTMLMNTQLTIRSTFTIVKLSARAEVTGPKGVVLNSDVPDGAISALIGHR